MLLHGLVSVSSFRLQTAIKTIVSVHEQELMTKTDENL